MYSEDNPEDGIYMIHHEFTDNNGELLEEDDNPVPISGTAKMWILIPKLRKEKNHIRKTKVNNATKKTPR
jgi:hypothetical protein